MSRELEATAPARPWWRGRLTARLAPFARYLGAAAILGLTTVVAEALFQFTGDTRLSMVFLAAVLITGVLLGSGPAYFAAVSAFLVYNFYLVEPRFTITMDSPEDMLTLVMFTVSAALTSSLTGRIRDQAARERARAKTTSALYDATREFSASSEEEFIRTSLVRHLALAARGGAMVRDGLRVHSDPPNLPLDRALVLDLTAAQRAATSLLSASTDAAGGWTIRALRVGEARYGVAAWRAGEGMLRPEELKLLEILVDTGATAIARARLSAAKAEAESQARTEALRNALLSSISHDLRTPLAAIMVSAGSLRRYGETLDAATREDLAVNIEEEATRLDDFVANLLNMARLESGELLAQRIGFDVPQAIDRAVARRNTGQRKVSVEAPADLPAGVGDPLLFEQALGNVVENALRYSSEAQPVTVAARNQDDTLIVEVLDSGCGVPARELPRIFEKFFRSTETLNKPGTGLGLAIARGLLEGMGGAIAASNRDDGQSGLRVSLQLPVMK